MKKTIITLLLVAFVGLQEALAIDIFGDLRYMVRLGYSLGGTAPVGMPATIRSLDKYTPTNNTLLGLDAYKPLTEKWGLQAGFHYQNKGMKTDAKVKGYSMEMRRGDETLSGLFTGNVVTEVDEWMVTLPLSSRDATTRSTSALTCLTQPASIEGSMARKIAWISGSLRENLRRRSGIPPRAAAAAHSKSDAP